MKLSHLTLSLMVCTLALTGCNDNKKKEKAVEKEEKVQYQAPYTVGAQRLVFTNDNITKTLTPKLKSLMGMIDGDSRELMIKIWYPALPTQNEKDRHDYGFHTKSQPFPFDPESDEYEGTVALLQNLAKESQTYYDAAPIENISYPVIFDSHGYSLPVEMYQTYYESLVQQGYVVVATSHSQESSYVTVNNNVGIGLNDAMDYDTNTRIIPE